MVPIQYWRGRLDRRTCESLVGHIEAGMTLRASKDFEIQRGWIDQCDTCT